MQVEFSRLRTAREALGLSLADVAARVRRSESTISKVETGSAKPSSRLLDALICELGINEDWLTSGEGSMFAPGPDEIPLLPEIVRLWAARKRILGEVANLSKAISEAEGALHTARRRELNEVKQRLILSDAPFNLASMPLPSEEQALAAFRRRLRGLLSHRGSKRELARAFGVTPQAVSEWVSGKSSPEAGKLLRLIAWVRAQEENQRRATDVTAPGAPETLPEIHDEEETESGPGQA